MITPKLLGALAAVQAGAATLGAGLSWPLMAIGGLSVGSVVTAIGTVFVMREKIRRGEEDRKSDREEMKVALTGITAAFKDEMRQARDDHKDDMQRIRDDHERAQEKVDTKLETLTTSISQVRELIATRSAQRRAGD